MKQHTTYKKYDLGYELYFSKTGELLHVGEVTDQFVEEHLLAQAGILLWSSFGHWYHWHKTGIRMLNEKDIPEKALLMAMILKR